MTRSMSTAMLAMLVAVACDRGEPPPPPPPPAQQAPAAQGTAQTATAPQPTGTTQPRGRTGQFEVIDVEIGTALGANGRVAAPADRLPSSDTIYAVLETDGRASNVALVTRWTAVRGTLGQLLDTQSQTISPDGPAFTPFKITKAGGWPAGTYRLEITANGAMAVSKDFTVQ